MDGNQESTIPVNISYNAMSVLIYSSDHNFGFKDLKKHKEALISVAKDYINQIGSSGTLPLSLSNVYLDDLSYLGNHNFLKNKGGVISLLGDDISDIMRIDVRTDKKSNNDNLIYPGVFDDDSDQIKNLFDELSHPDEVITCPTYKNNKTVPFSCVNNSTNALNNLLYGMTVPQIGVEEPIGGNVEDNYSKLN